MSIIIAIVLMLIIGIITMYHTRGFWNLESNNNANTLNCSLNMLSSSSFYPLVFVVIIVIAAFLLMSIVKGFG